MIPGNSPPDGACASCGATGGSYSPLSEVVICEDCRLPWPSDYWREQAQSEREASA